MKITMKMTVSVQEIGRDRWDYFPLSTEQSACTEDTVERTMCSPVLSPDGSCECHVYATEA